MADAVIVNADTGEQERRALTAAEEEARAQDAAQAQAQADAEAAAAAKRAADEQAWRDALKNATTVAAIRDVLLGTNLPAQAGTRPTGR